MTLTLMVWVIRLKAEYASQVKASENSLIPSSDITSDANGEIEGMVNDRHKGALDKLIKVEYIKEKEELLKRNFQDILLI